MSRKTLSLAWELIELQAAVEAARILIDGIRHQQFGNDHDMKAAPHAASAVLALVGLRLREVWRAVQGTKNAAESVWAAHNATTATRTGDDIYLREWSADSTLRKSEAALARARAAVGRGPKRHRKAKR